MVKERSDCIAANVGGLTENCVLLLLIGFPHGKHRATLGDH